MKEKVTSKWISFGVMLVFMFTTCSPSVFSTGETIDEILVDDIQFFCYNSGNTKKTQYYIQAFQEFRNRSSSFEYETTGCVSDIGSKDSDTTSKNKDIDSEYWALIIAGEDETIRFDEEGTYMKNVLLSSGWSDDHVITLFNEEATKINLINMITWLSENINPQDIVLINMIDHGGIGSFGLYNGFIYYDELDFELDKIQTEAMGIIIDACHSGSAIPYLQQDGRVILTSCRSDETSGLISGSIATGLIGFADKKTNVGDNNDIVSLEEAYYYMIEEVDFIAFTPQIQDNLTGELNLIFLDNSFDKMDQFPINNLWMDAFERVGGTSHGGFMSHAAQSFKPSMNILTKVKLFLIRSSETKYPLTVSIRSSLKGEDLTSVTVDSSMISDHLKAYYEFDFEDTELDTNTVYYIVCNSTYVLETFAYYWSGRENNCYDHGRSYASEDYGETWFESIYTADLFFVTYGYNDDNQPPVISPIDGPSSGNVNIEYDYWFEATDPDGDDVSYWIEWGDGGIEGDGWIGPYNSGNKIKVTHAWSEQSSYTIKVKAKDEWNFESDWATLEVSMPKNKELNNPPFLQLLEKIIQKFPVLGQILTNHLFQ
jgi:hypothetical protein